MKMNIFMTAVNDFHIYEYCQCTCQLVSGGRSSKNVDHHNGKFMKAWLPKASTENERSTVVIETPEGVLSWRARLPEHGTPYRDLCRSRRRLLY